MTTDTRTAMNVRPSPFLRSGARRLVCATLVLASLSAVGIVAGVALPPASACAAPRSA
jgi:hypothetical protein